MTEILTMTKDHVEDVCVVENAVFPIPWSFSSFLKEMDNCHAYYFVAKVEDKIIGFSGMWHIVNEGHITNIAVLPEYRNNGIGKMLCNALFSKGKELGMIGITLEVRISNIKAQKMYANLGFRAEGVRKKYYEDTNEDAVIMWKLM